ncbi:MAG: FG-GAP repeat domain-containing protein [Pirellulales bacterium]
MTKYGLTVICLVEMWTSAVGLHAAVSDESGTIRPRIIRLDFSVSDNSSSSSGGGVVTADLDGDGLRDFVVTSPGHIGGYRHDGTRLWHLREDVRVSAGSSESVGLPGHHSPGVQVADVDGDGKAELLYLDQSSTVHIRDAKNGREERPVRVPHPKGSERWEHLVVVNLRGKGDVDLMLQTT